MRYRTGHVRDAFGADVTMPSEVGPALDSLTPCPVEPAYMSDGAVHGVIITIDHFGNLISNIDSSAIEHFRVPLIQTAGKSFHLQNTYGDAAPGELLALQNSFDVIEISRSNGNAAEALGLGRGTPVVVRESARSG